MAATAKSDRASDDLVVYSSIFKSEKTFVDGIKGVKTHSILEDVQIWPAISDKTFSFDLNEALDEEYDRSGIPPDVLYRPITVNLRDFHQVAGDAVVERKKELEHETALSAPSSGWPSPGSDRKKDPDYSDGSGPSSDSD
ncbi:MAG: hypothetical protein Q9220_006169 [cf. Caloplaca sp. 1 TL-2023]